MPCFNNPKEEIDQKCGEKLYFILLNKLPAINILFQYVL